ncbi:GH36-type glycosyl hydrolase domain-containing protein [Marinilactibacillus sp. Marseille-P9653]|uniref:GH36-type glycosyl hydrolase domain-containing protein n=1 Tax=Marinilactibacillus sp. Marseille-P9653 TaxID=2866583 RepID=UPI001CE422CE|nr:amylo-alpha-1,6-glucosidase [Marinilactibacillus sp. Marseille-P9653]
MKSLVQAKKYMHTLKQGQTIVTFLKSGDLYKIKYEDIMINQIEGNMIDGALNNMYLRRFDEKGTVLNVAPLLGIQSKSQFSIGKTQASWKGSIEEVDYTVRFSLAEDKMWFWEIELSGANETVDVVYGQDLGLASEAALKANEAYVAQYVDHMVSDTDLGYVISSRQNQPQSGLHPYLQQGSLTGVDGFLTDGFQFFGKAYKETNRPEALNQIAMENKKSQFEFDYSTLKSRSITLSADESSKVIFYNLFKESHPKAVEKVEDLDRIQTAYQKLRSEELITCETIKKQETIGEPLETIEVSQEDLKKYYPNRVQDEMIDGRIVSFFTEDQAHVVLKEKELMLERPHGQILFTHNKTVPDETIMSTTSWMYGVFNAQLVMGNTDMNKALSNTRNAVNFFKTSGQRIYIKVDETYRLLTMPSLMEIGINHVKWIYQTENETFTVLNVASSKDSLIQLSVSSESGTAYEYLITNQMTMNSREYQTPVWYEEKDGAVYTTFDEKTAAHQKLPELTYKFQVNHAESKIVGESSLLTGVDEGTAMLLNFQVSATDQFTFTMEGSLTDQTFETHELDFNLEKQAFAEFFDQLSNGFSMSGPEPLTNISDKMNLTTRWYTHNMLVHYLVPHGLEQFGGAAWGTRDVSQGPAEYLLAMQKYGSTREVIERVYSHQHLSDGNWPQWFMFDSYVDVQADESHGDVIVWPLKMLADYLEITNDYSILDQRVPYFDQSTKSDTETSEPIKAHVAKQLEYIQSNFLWDTMLSSYGDGDWDDTLQPHDQSLKKNMASSWTIALTYQTLKKFAEVLESIDQEWAQAVKELTEKIEQDFKKYISSNEVVPGFVYMPNEKEIVKMIHPDDTTTGIQYRLLPMIRGMISELFTKEQAEHHFELIQTYLNTPDGVRLMNRPATYKGGVSRQFKRAEQAANFGREIGLMYVHAHIRYIEAMAKIGQAQEVWKGLETINPINISEVVKNAEVRQSNTYFSSSDADFSDRYEAQENFDLVKKGEVKVKGGWRIYSSGPGIYMNQLISSALGIRVQSKNLVLDPVLKKEQDELTVTYQYNGYPLNIQFHYTNNDQVSVQVNGEEILQQTLKNPYRNAGVKLDHKTLEKILTHKINTVDVFYPVY